VTDSELLKGDREKRMTTWEVASFLSRAWGLTDDQRRRMFNAMETQENAAVFELKARAESAEASLKEAREALQRYGKHLPCCNLNNQTGWDEAQAALNDCPMDEGYSQACFEIDQGRKKY
jgi:hypothetical protein